MEGLTTVIDGLIIVVGVFVGVGEGTAMLILGSAGRVSKTTILCAIIKDESVLSGNPITDILLPISNFVKLIFVRVAGGEYDDNLVVVPTSILICFLSDVVNVSMKFFESISETALYSHAAKKLVKNFKILEAGAGKSFSDYLQEIINKEKIKTLGIETGDLKVSEFNTISKKVNKTKHFDLSILRIYKTDYEINSIKKSCEIGDKAYAYILKQITEGQSEKNIAFELEFFIRKTGAGLSFETVVAFGPNAAIPHHKTGDQKLKKGMCVLIDFGVKYKNYCSDMTRTFFLGRASNDDKKVYQTALESQQIAIEYIESSLAKNKKVISANVDGKARDYVVKQGYPPFNHSSHGIGLEVHEAPHISSSKDALVDGMVFSIEPGIYLPDKMGVRIEDIFAIQNNKLVPLTISPKKFFRTWLILESRKS